MKSVIFTFGKFNPPTLGHEKLFKFMVEEADGSDVIIGTTFSSAPLDYPFKVEILQNMAPGCSVEVHTSPYHILENLVSVRGYKDIRVVLGSDRAVTLNGGMGDYAKKWGATSFDVVTFGSPRDSSGISTALVPLEKISSTALRDAIIENDFLLYSCMMPEQITTEQQCTVVDLVKQWALGSGKAIG